MCMMLFFLSCFSIYVAHYYTLIPVLLGVIGLGGVLLGNNYLSDIKTFKFRDVAFEKKIYFSYFIGAMSPVVWGLMTSAISFILALVYAFPALLFVITFILKIRKIKYT